MLVFEKRFVLTEQEDGSYTLSIKVNDSFANVVVVTEAELRELKLELEEKLPEE